TLPIAGNTGSHDGILLGCWSEGTGFNARESSSERAESVLRPCSEGKSLDPYFISSHAYAIFFFLIFQKFYKFSANLKTNIAAACPKRTQPRCPDRTVGAIVPIQIWVDYRTRSGWILVAQLQAEVPVHAGLKHARTERPTGEQVEVFAIIAVEDVFHACGDQEALADLPVAADVINDKTGARL